MKLVDILESKLNKKLVVIMGGRYQPFHRGHYESYLWLCNKFGEDNVWIATSNKTNFNPKSGDISPFSFKEKKEIMVSLYKINPRRIIQCKNPAFKPDEVFDLYKGFPIIYITAVGEKDEERYKTGTFFKEIPKPFIKREANMMLTLEDDVGYYVKIPMQVEEISGTKVREELKNAIGDDREKLFKEFFGRYDSTIDQLIISKLKDIKEPK